MIPRYGQLAYTSFDSVGAAGGWQIKQVNGELTVEEKQTLVAGVRTVFEPDQALPAYPTPEDLERGPRRLAYRRADAGACYWHTVPAGPDATGRPGNVFAHAVLDRTPDDPPRHRPIQWWRSPLWCRPYGPAAVATAQLPDEPPTPADSVSRDSVIAFALDTTTWRLGTLFGLLDAIDAALQGGPPVVLGVASPDDAAQWIGLISYLMSAGTASRLNFSTFDRAGTLGPSMQAGQHLTAMPRADLANLPPGFVVIDDAATLSLGEYGAEPHRTANGDTITVTAWSAMAQVVLLDAASAHAALDDIDHYAALTDDTGLHPAWPLAMAVTARDHLADAHPEARNVIAAHTPPAPPDSVVARTLAGVAAHSAGISTAEAWQAVQKTPSGPAARLIDLTYLTRAVADNTWLDQLGPVPVGPRTYHGHPVPEELSAALGPALSTARAAGPDRVLRLIDLLIRAGVGDGRLPRALATDVVGALRDPHTGPRLAARLRDRIGAATRLALTAEVLRAGVDADGEVPISAAVADWLADGIAAPPPQALSRARNWDTTWLCAAVRGVRTLQGGDYGEVTAEDRRAALWWLRVAGARRFDAVAGAAVWDPHDLLVAAGDRLLVSAAVLPTLLGSADSADLDELAQSIANSHTDDVATACAALRLADLTDWVQQGYTETHQRAYTVLWQEALAQLPPGSLHPDAVVRLVAMAMIAVINGQPYPPSCNALAADTALAAEAVAQVNALADAEMLAPGTVIAVSLARTVDLDGEATVVISGIGPLVDEVARHVAGTREFSGDDVDATAALIAQLTGSDSGGAQRRYRKMVGKMLTRGLDRHATLSAETRGSH